jgi:hypothetical protein
MPALPQPVYGISNLYLFPVYQTREAYKQATGQDAPPYDPAKRLKAWFDPTAASNPRLKIIYDTVLSMDDQGHAIAGPDGKPMLEPQVIARDEAGRVNIPVKGPGIPDQPYTGPEWPVPLRALEPNEELFFQFMGIPAVKNKDLFPTVESGFSGVDRKLLQAIAVKLGVS